MVGRSNVGKSSLINAVLNRKSIARVSNTPGKTQAVQFYLVNDRFYLVDLPGYGYAKVSKEVKRSWQELVGGYLEDSAALRLMFLLLDCRRVPGSGDIELHEWMRSASVDRKLVLTKSDKLSKSQLAASRAAIARELDVAAEEVISLSTVTRQGVDQVRREMFSRL